MSSCFAVLRSDAVVFLSRTILFDCHHHANDHATKERANIIIIIKVGSILVDCIPYYYYLLGYMRVRQRNSDVRRGGGVNLYALSD